MSIDRAKAGRAGVPVSNVAMASWCRPAKEYAAPSRLCAWGYAGSMAVGGGSCPIVTSSSVCRSVSPRATVTRTSMFDVRSAGMLSDDFPRANLYATRQLS